MGESRNPYRVLVGRPEGKRTFGRPRRRWEDNIKMDLREVGYDDREWINLAQDRDRWRAYVFNKFCKNGPHLLFMGLDERLGIAKEGENERGTNRPYFGCGIKTATCNSPERISAVKQKELSLKMCENIDPDF
ncbi:hypothetical protein ANN_25743 [Periplaneta americana]|uniref:Uncharacterized protein n=1 Tax=Periplaneta americana TaxID=6978 RepID=A0ABQ8S4I9_PERAM|nr:hypothetical protein ANN_25743 [Periplaneta americana]